MPAFDLPPAPADGGHTVKELRVKGTKLVDTDLTVHGFITWAYDCPTTVRKPEESDKDVQKRIDEDPTLCERAKFYIGDDKTTPAEKSLWIVDVPRPYNKLEMERMKKPERNLPDRCEPNEKDRRRASARRTRWATRSRSPARSRYSSPHSERNSDGLIVYKKMKNITQNWETPDIAPPPGAEGTPTTPPATRPSPEDLVQPKH